MLSLLRPLRHLVDFCYPRICAACDALGADDVDICQSCFDLLKKLEGAAACEKCAMPLAQDGTPCPYCLGQGVKPYEGILRLSVFDAPVRDLIHQIKYHGRWTLAEFLADRLLEQEPIKALLSQTDVLVPVPLHPWRQMTRGYNQAEIIARRLAKKSGIKVASPIVRLKNTETQTNLHSKLKRFDNLRDAFGLLRPQSVEGKHVVVIDDVMTTGATLSCAGRCIAEAEPASLCAIVVAVADPRGRDFEAI